MPEVTTKIIWSNIYLTNEELKLRKEKKLDMIIKIAT